MSLRQRTINFSLPLVSSIFLFLFPVFLPRSISFSFSELLLTFWSLSFRALLSQSRSPREATRAASIQTLHLVHYEYHDFANLFGMDIFKTRNREWYEPYEKVLVYCSVYYFYVFSKTNIHWIDGYLSNQEERKTYTKIDTKFIRKRERKREFIFSQKISSIHIFWNILNVI